jgi:putative transposase
MSVLSHLHQLFNADTCHTFLHTLRWNDRPLQTKPRCGLLVRKTGDQTYSSWYLAKRVRRLLRCMGLEAISPKPNMSRAATEHRIYPDLLHDVAIARVDYVL